MRTTRERLLASTMICGAALVALAAGPSYAQQAGAGTEVKEVVVTGSRIRQPNLTTTSPVTTINSADVKLQGGTRIEDVVNQLPQAFAAQGSTISNAASGTATVDLRGLGSARTLVLVDGRRLVPGDPATPVADLNMIPNALVDRIDVVSGGASAVYGSDAVAGVVNFLMRKNFEGVQIDANYGVYQHRNDNDFAQAFIAQKAATNPQQFALPPENVMGGAQRDVTITLGANAPDGKGNVEGYLGWRSVDPVLQSRYDYSACSLGAPEPSFVLQCSGSSTAFPGRFITEAGSGSSFTVADAAGHLRPYASSTDAYNFAPTNYFQRPDVRYTAGVFGHYQVNKAMDVYAQAMFMDDRTVAQIAPSGLFLQTMKINCDSPLLSADAVSKFCGAGVDQDGDSSNGVQAVVDSDPLTPGIQGDANVAIGRRNAEGGGRQDNRQHTSFRLVLGAKGEIASNWRYDLYGQYGQSNFSENYSRDFSVQRAGRALQVVTDNRPGSATFGQAVCKSVIDGTDPNCVPYDIFHLGGVTQAALDYLQTPGFQSAVSREEVVSGSIDGELADYGLISPWAKDGAAVAFGAEYRRETLDFRTDAEFTTGDLAGQGGATIGTNGAYDVKEVFFEGRLPLVQDKPFAEDLSLDAGYRRSSYSGDAGDTNTYKVEGNWTPVHDVRFRASYNRSVRAPNIIELFSPQRVALDGATDPCAGSAPAYTAAQCAFSGVTAGQYGNIIENPAGQYNGILGGNPNLKPETSDTWSVGFVAQPRFLPGFNLTVDWFDIGVKDFIAAIGADTIVTGCVESGDPTLCALVHRAPGNGSLWLNPNGYVNDVTQNTGLLRTKGVDVQANYRLNLADVGLSDAGRIDVNLVGTWLGEYHVEPFQGTSFAQYDCDGRYGPTCGAPRPEWRHKLRATWTTPWKGLQLSGQWRYIAAVDRLDGSDAGDNVYDKRLPSRSYFDLSGSWRVRDKTTVRMGVNNLFDKDPPIVLAGHGPSGPLNGNTFPQVYDSLGRYLFLNVTQSF